MNKIEKIKELTDELLVYCHEYYDLDSPSISDAEYDKKFDELKRLEDEENFWLANSPTRKVQGKVLDCFTKVTHSKPMLSAAKTKDPEEIKKFLGNQPFYCSYKCDGLTLVVRYENGQFIQAVTRGNGEIGEDVTEQAKMIQNIPMNIPYLHPLELRGECVISWDSFKQINSTLETPYSHPRNLAAGSLRQLDTNITKQRTLSYIVFECVSDLYDGDTLFDSKWDELGYLDWLGFETVGRCHGNVDDCVQEMNPDGDIYPYNYPVDGLVFEMCIKSYSKSLPSTGHHEGCRMALKWADTTYETTLLDIEWNPTRTGMISPVAVFEEVDLDGALTTRATLHNLSIIEQLELGIGDTITVYRSNMVIPKIDDNLTRSNTLTIPKICPCCGAPTEVKNTDNSKVLMCTNPHCSAKKIAQFTHFVSRKAMNIDGLSEKTLETFISHGFLHDYNDIYHLSEHRNELILLDGYGVKSIDSLLKSIENSRNVKLENFICALGIDGVGSSASKTIANYFHGDFINFNNAFFDRFDYTKLDDIGPTTAKNIDIYMANHSEDVYMLAQEMHFIVPEKNDNNNILAGKNICVTGKLINFTRDSINEKIVSLGGKAVGSVSKNTHYLINNDNNSTSGKNKKAKELGVPIITETEFLQMVGE